MYLVIRWNGTKQVAVDRDGTEWDDPALAEMYADEYEAEAMAKKCGGKVVDEDELF